MEIETYAPREHYYIAPNIKVKHSVFKIVKPSKTFTQNSVVDPDSFNPDTDMDPDPAFQMNQNPDLDPEF
jgi:hypothetical protein